MLMLPNEDMRAAGGTLQPMDEPDGIVQAGAVPTIPDSTNSQGISEKNPIQNPAGKADTGYDLSTREGNLRMMDAARGSMGTIQAKMQNNDLMEENAQHREQLGKLNTEHAAGKIGDAEYTSQIQELNAEIEKMIP